jgi:tetratricopeptide (TPR) repeat protein
MWEKAIPEYRESLHYWPDYHQARHDLAYALYIVGNYREAIANYKRVLGVDPAAAQWHNDLANAIRGFLAENAKATPMDCDTGGEYPQFSDAIKEHRTALKESGERQLVASFHIDLGKTFAACGNQEMAKAEDDLGKKLASTP